jgi:hypothetical protein
MPRPRERMRSIRELGRRDIECPSDVTNLLRDGPCYARAARPEGTVLMASDSEETIGCVIGVVALIGGAIWLYNNYEIRKREPSPIPPVATALAKPTVTRPTGTIQLSESKSGSKWLLDADSVSGTRKARQGWITVDSSQDKTATVRITRTLYLVDCDTTAARRLSEAAYKASDSPVSTESYDPKDAKIDYYPPNTMGGAVVRRLCNTAFGP